jgi:hypothetical protein
MPVLSLPKVVHISTFTLAGMLSFVCEITLRIMKAVQILFVTSVRTSQETLRMRYKGIANAI